MRMSKLYLPTLKEDPAEAEIISHKLMLRAGLMRALTAGIYSYLPLGYRVIRKVEAIIRQAIDESGAQEILMPVMQTAELWQESGRWDKFGPLMVKFEDRKGRGYCLGPTHEEVITGLVRDEIRSYKDLPLNLYQIQTKVRDEIRPRFGVMRGREFIMKDAYSFDRDFDGLDKSYQAMYDAYEKAFERCGLQVRAVKADTGAMGGKDSHEFMVLAESGEDDVAFCKECEYAANLEKAEAGHDKDKNEDIKLEEIKKVSTPGQKSIEEISNYLGVKAEKTIKALGLLVDDKPVVVLLRGDDSLNEIKLKNFFDAVEITPAADDKFAEYFDSAAGFIGPVALKKDIEIIADNRIENIKNAVVGANEEDFHYVNANPDRDFSVDKYLDLRLVKAGDRCPECGGELEIKSGIEVGHIFKLGTKYSKSMGAAYLDENGKEQLIVMGSYGIGVTRLVAAAIEQNHDENGIIWPKSIAPYDVIILELGKSDKVKNVSEKLYKMLKNIGIEVLLDDRKERAGVKFNDADLIGIPLRITIGNRSVENEEVEIKLRTESDVLKVPLDSAVEKTYQMLK